LFSSGSTTRTIIDTGKCCGPELMLSSKSSANHPMIGRGRATVRSPSRTGRHAAYLLLQRIGYACKAPQHLLIHLTGQIGIGRRWPPDLPRQLDNPRPAITLTLERKPFQIVADDRGCDRL
jgi:hypothetical protein